VAAASARLGLAATGAEGFARAQAAVTQALGLVQKAKDLEERKAKASETLTTAQVRFDAAQMEIKPLLHLAPDEETEALRAILRRSTEAARLRRDLKAVEDEIVGHGEGRALAELVQEVSGADPDVLATEAQDFAGQLDTLNARIEAQSAELRAADMEFSSLGDSPEAAIAAFEMAEARSEMAEQAELYIRKRAELKLLRAAIDRYRREKQAPMLARASTLFSTLTLGAFSRLIVDFDGDTPRLAGVRAGGAVVTPVEGMSEGTVDQLYLALRIAAVEDAVDQGARLPFLADDLFVNFDDDRAAAGFRVLSELARKTQVLFFTHHAHLGDVARRALGRDAVSTCELEREAAPATAA
jgi:uncharacterized protein YhaN